MGKSGQFQIRKTLRVTFSSEEALKQIKEVTHFLQPLALTDVADDAVPSLSLAGRGDLSGIISLLSLQYNILYDV